MARQRKPIPYKQLQERMLSGIKKPSLKIRSLRVIKGKTTKWGDQVAVSDSSDIYEFLKSVYKKNMAQEQFIMIVLNQANRILGIHKHTTGTKNSTSADVTLLAAVAIKSGAVSVILSHNHPSGNNKASEADIAITKRILKTMEVIGINVLDHVIYTEDNGYYSLADNGDI